MKKILRYLLVPLVLLCCSWGFMVHRTINQLAVYQLPKPMLHFFFANKDSIATNAPRPDKRRSIDSTEATKHFIDLEAFGDSAAWKMPLHWNDAVKQYGKDSLITYGYLPYQIIVMKNKLTNAFTMRNRDSIIFYATDIGHYIGDAHVPLHTTINYDGQLTNQKGLHDLWETTVPELALNQYTLSSRRQAKYLFNPEEAIWKTVRKSHSLLTETLNIETEVSKKFTDSTKYFTQFRWGKKRRFYSPAFVVEYNKRLAASINNQLLLSAAQIADFWYTAWVDAGRPDLSPLLLKPFGKAEKIKLRSESREYQKNKLIEKNLLLAMQEKDN